MTTLLALLVLALVACGGGNEGADADAGTSGTSAGADEPESGDDNGGVVVDQQPAGQATVSVDGQEFTLTESGALDCVLNPEVITFSFWIGDNTTTLGGGANLYDDGWLGNLRLSVIDDEGLPVQYYPADGAMDGGVVIDGDSMSFSGPMLMQPPNDGSNPPPVDVGNGTISATCG